MPGSTKQNSNPPATGPGIALRLFGIPLFVHWSVLPIDLCIAANTYIASKFIYSNADWRVAAASGFSYTLSIVAHEFGHASAAACRGLKVHRIYVSGGANRCFTDPPRTARSAGWLYSGGLLAHSVLLGGVACGLALFGWPQSLPLHCALYTFVAVNLISIVLTLIPYRQGGYASDGLQLWRLFKKSGGHLG